MKALMRERVCSEQLPGSLNAAQDNKVCYVLHSTLSFLDLTLQYSEANIFKLGRGKEKLTHPPLLSMSSLLLSAPAPPPLISSVEGYMTMLNQVELNTLLIKLG